MNFVRLNKIVGILCLALIPVVVVLVTLTGNQEQGELAAKWLMVLLAVWLPFLCLRCIQVGHIYLPTQGDIYKNERSEEHTSELQSRGHLVCRLLLEKKKNNTIQNKNDDTP